MSDIRLLILGGTREARDLADWAVRQTRLTVVTSLAGRVARPALPQGEVRIGGFGGVDGMAEYLRLHRIGFVVDATHPFAAQISESAARACRETGLRRLVLRRPGYKQEAGDIWVRVPDLPSAAAVLPDLGKRVFLTTGRQGLHEFAHLPQFFLVRCVDPPTGPVPASMELLLSRGPYTCPDELELIQRHRLDLLVSKDSGGPLTEGKLQAARELGLPVVMVDRPSVPAGSKVVPTVHQAQGWVAEQLVQAGPVG